MFGLRLGFDHPGYLWLLAALPLLWWFSFSSLAALGPFRRFLAIFLRTVVLTAFVFALAGVQLVWTSDRITVMYLLDQSESIPAAKRQQMLQYVIENVRKHRDQARQDRAGIVVFGREATIEIPPFDDDIPQLRRLESYLGRTDGTNLEAAFKLAQASMPADTSRRVVIVTDGNENLGNARELSARLAESGIGIDVVPVELDARAEVLVEKIDLPKDIRKGQPFEARVVIDNYTDGEATGPPVSGRLKVVREVNGEEELLLEEPVTLDPGKNVFPLRHQIDQPAPYTYSASFVADREEDDGLQQNNQASAYTYVKGEGQILLIEDFENPGNYDLVVERLREANLEVEVRPSNQLFGSLAQLQAYDAVIMAGVPRVSGSSADEISSFSEDQIEMLVRNTQQLGCGLLMIGGPEALGAGGWAGTKLEEAMPVDFKVDNNEVRAVGALALIMHASEMAQGNHWQKVVARSAIEQLGPMDYAGVLHWSMAGDSWLWGGRNGLIPVANNRNAMIAAIKRMTPGDMPQFDPAMRMAVAGLARTNAAMKHTIIISDGDPSAPTQATLNAFVQNNITISTVAVESHGLAGSRQLQQIAQKTGGKYYSVRNAKALPKIFQREARRVSRPLVHEIPAGAAPQVIYPHPTLEGIDTVLPPITGFVLTQTKQSPLAQVLVRSPSPQEADNATILAVWTYGLGRTAVLTTDSGGRWARSWTDWADYDKFYSQLVRWLMRPSGDTGKFDLATQVRDGEIQIVVTALDQEDEFLNFLDISASALDPELNALDVRMRQTAPGRYVGTLPADRAGNYFINVAPQAPLGDGSPDSRFTPLTTGITVPYSEEFRVREANRSLLSALAEIDPAGGEPGEMTEPLSAENLDELTDRNTFRGGLGLARSIRDAWPWFVLAACCLFLGDVMVRRVAINFEWAGRLLAQWTGRDRPQDQTRPSRLQTLKERKQEVGESIDRRRAATRFQPNPEAETSAPAKEPDVADASSAAMSKKAAGGLAPDGRPEKSYTERLLEAKRRARGDDN